MLFAAMFACEARLGSGLLPRFPGNTRGVGVTFPAPSAGPVGQLSLGVLRWLLEQRWADRRSARKVKTGPALKAPDRQGRLRVVLLRGRDEPFVL